MERRAIISLSRPTFQGGDPLLSNAIPQWIPSIADYRNWRVIDVRSAVPITDFVDEEHRDDVKRLMKAKPSKPLKGR